MASGDTLVVFGPQDNEAPSANFATIDSRNSNPCLDFDAAADEIAVFSSVLPRSYAGGGITVYLHYAMTSATTGNVVLTGAFERIGDGQQDIDSDGFASAKSVTQAVPATSGHVDIANIAFTNGAEIDSIAVGEKFRLKITRDADNVSDDAAGDLELVNIEIKEI
jgi:hypothetical protein